MSVSSPVPVALAQCPDYAPDRLAALVPRLLDATGVAFRPGETVLVKPNLVAAGNPLACTEPAVARAVCAYLLDLGARVVVADSPAFGTADGVARKCGLAQTLAPLGIPVRTLGNPEALRLSFGASIGLSRDALEADRILNLPRLKAHCQMRITAAVKNLFGCVCGMRKAIAHTRFGECDNRFEAMITEVCAALPPVVTLLDGVNAMHESGPRDGSPFALGLLAASANPQALDTALYGLLKLSPADIALWREAIARALPGADPADIAYPLDRPEAFDATGFVVPGILDPVAFRPTRLARGALRRLYAKIS
ncbi:uncharacterized protein (DUF362 family) [Desulfobaculum xiamenense]|uniref:Uncharacterized protein (DUF362 family) n=1 Tax=Desulfobaculum xiamenense TaxID=995050 RepID=A0A846QKW8_9BACT|nr:DUF362 domain-containing protein [Desulfobaculum xiamenense]NJB68828.1 uncharacterized protein (DUF362 family) [Desulfobaculum xiamenense]